MTNGNGMQAAQHQDMQQLPPTREAVVEQGNRIHQEVCHERDELRRRLDQAMADIAGYKVALEAQTMQLNSADSRLETLTLQRDQAVADRAIWETLWISIQAQLRAFKVPQAPLVTGGEHDQDVLDVLRFGPDWRRPRDPGDIG